MPSVRASSPSSRILVRGVNWLGDAVMTIPALLRLREKEPLAEITLLCHEKLADLWREHPAVDLVITFSSGEQPWSIGRRLRPHNFQKALIFPGSVRSALEVWFANIPDRIGYSRAWGDFFLTQVVPPRTERVRVRKRSAAEARELIRSKPAAPPTRFPQSAHQIFDYLHLAAKLGASEAAIAPRLQVSRSEILPVSAKFDLQKSDRPIFGIIPGADYGPAKCWPIESFSAAAVQIQKQINCQWLIFGTASQSASAELIRARILEQRSPDSSASTQAVRPPLNLTGQTSLRELCVLLSLCRAVLTNDSGPMHVAAALGTPVVVPFGSTSPDLTGPWDAHAKNQILVGQAPCAPCFRRECPVDFRCMTSISVETVVRAFLSSLQS